MRSTMAPKPVVTGLSPKEGPPGTRVVIRGEFLGKSPIDLTGLTICGFDCLLSAEWKSTNKIIAHTGPTKGKGDVVITTISGGVGTSTVQFRAYHEMIGPMTESAVWVEESSRLLAWGRRNIAPVGYTHDDPLGLSIEGIEQKYPEDIGEIFREGSADLSQENFFPGSFLLQNHHSTAFKDLKAGLAYNRRKVESQKDSQLSFLKSNTGSVLDQLDTLILILNQMQENRELEVGSILKDIGNTINNSIAMSTEVFRSVLERREKADSSRISLMALNRHRFLFCLPGSIDRYAALGVYDGIINDYSRAMNFFGKSDSAVIEIFRKLKDEVDHRMINVGQNLHDALLKHPQSIKRQQLQIKCLIDIMAQAKILPDLNCFDPAWDAIDARANYIELKFKKVYNDGLQKVYNLQSKHNNVCELLDRAAITEEICNIAFSQLPDMWRLGQAYFTGEIRTIQDPSSSNFKNIILTCINNMTYYLRNVIFYGFGQRGTGRIFPIAWSTICSTSMLVQLLHHLPRCLRYLRNTYVRLIQLDLPGEALDIVQKCIDDVRIFCLSSYFMRSVDRIKKIVGMEAWENGIENLPSVTLLPSMLEKIILEMFEDGRSCTEQEEREKSILKDSEECYTEVSLRFKEVFMAFYKVVEDLAYCLNEEFHNPLVSQLIELPNQQEVSCSYHNRHTWAQHMLCCMANCLHCQLSLFSHLESFIVRYGYTSFNSVVEDGKSLIKQLFANLLDTYVEHKSDPLVGTIEPSMYIGRFQWDSIEYSGTLRPYARECNDNLVGVFSEIVTISANLLHPIMEPIVQMIAEELARLMSCVPTFNRQGVVQANIDVQYLSEVLSVFSNDKARCYFKEALEVIGPLTVEENLVVKSIKDQLKNRLQLQISCFCE